MDLDLQGEILLVLTESDFYEASIDEIISKVDAPEEEIQKAVDNLLAKEYLIDLGDEFGLTPEPEIIGSRGADYESDKIMEARQRAVDDVEVSSGLSPSIEDNNTRSKRNIFYRKLDNFMKTNNIDNPSCLKCNDPNSRKFIPQENLEEDDYYNVVFLCNDCYNDISKGTGVMPNTVDVRDLVTPGDRRELSYTAIRSRLSRLRDKINEKITCQSCGAVHNEDAEVVTKIPDLNRWTLVNFLCRSCAYKVKKGNLARPTLIDIRKKAYSDEGIRKVTELYMEIRRINLPQSCQVCDSTDGVDFLIPDTSDPLKVHVLCNSCLIEQKEYGDIIKKTVDLRKM